MVTRHVEKRAVTFYVILRSMLEQGPSFYPVLLHDSCTVFNPSFGKEGFVVNSGHVVALVSEIQPSSG